MSNTTPIEFPPGEYAIVELFGHQTLVGRIAEIERFGAKMLAIEPLFNGEFLAVVLHGGAAIYRFTPCSPEVAWNKQAKHAWELPTAIRAVLSPSLLEGPTSREIIEGDSEHERQSDLDYLNRDIDEEMDDEL